MEPTINYPPRKVLQTVLSSFLSVFFVIFGCTRSEFSDSLIVYPKAENVNFSKYKGTDQVSYKVVDDFPAVELTTWLSRQLEAKGWQPLKYDFLNPHLSSSQVTGWSKYIDGMKKEVVHSWSSDWKDVSGNIVRYSMQYRYPESSQPKLTEVQVTGIYMPVALVKEMEEGIEKFNQEHKQK